MRIVIELDLPNFKRSEVNETYDRYVSIGASREFIGSVMRDAMTKGPYKITMRVYDENGVEVFKTDPIEKREGEM